MCTPIYRYICMYVYKNVGNTCWSPTTVDEAAAATAVTAATAAVTAVDITLCK